MNIALHNVHISDCGTGISMPKDADIVAEGLRITHTDIAIELRDPPSQLASLGFHADTPPEYLMEAHRLLISAQGLPPAEQAETLRTSKLVEWLGASTDLLELAKTLLSEPVCDWVSRLAGQILD